MLNEYSESVGVDLCFQGFAQELAGLPGEYARPAGALLIALDAGVAVGMVAMRPRRDGRAEMKRLYVRAAARGTGLGRLLADAVICEGAKCGYSSIVLDTLPGMHTAQHLYETLGFRDIAPYYNSPVAGTRFMELPLIALR